MGAVRQLVLSRQRLIELALAPHFGDDPHGLDHAAAGMRRVDAEAVQLLRRGRAPFTALLTACIALALLATPDSAIAKRSASSPQDGAKKKGVTKITYQRSSSEETTAERDRRMYRECKGMHNAGACRGYTRK